MEQAPSDPIRTQYARPGHRRRNRAEDDGLSRAVCDCSLCEAGRVVGRRQVRCPGAPAATSVRGVLWRLSLLRARARVGSMDRACAVMEVVAAARVVQGFASRFLIVDCAYDLA